MKQEKIEKAENGKRIGRERIRPKITENNRKLASLHSIQERDNRPKQTVSPTHPRAARRPGTADTAPPPPCTAPGQLPP